MHEGEITELAEQSQRSAKVFLITHVAQPLSAWYKQ
jgi:hypothetical protein